MHEYPFDSLAKLLRDSPPSADLETISLAIGEPQHPPPPKVLECLRDSLSELSRYPTTMGLETLRAAISAWLAKRFSLRRPPDPEREILPLAGTREGLFSFIQAMVDSGSVPSPVVAMPNPGYQIYEGGALLAGAEPWYLDLRADCGFLPDLEAVPAAVWRRCQLLVLCSPGNPTGAVADLDLLQRAITLAHEHDFIIASDECYSEIYLDEASPPAGILQAAERLGVDAFERCVVFHSLSKRSNLPGLRSGFAAGDASLLHAYRRYRTYHGCALPIPTQLASVVAWSDEVHVRENRERYREKFALAATHLEGHLDAPTPAASFYLWARPPTDDEHFAREAWRAQALKLLPGRYLARTGPHGDNPGVGFVRLSLVADAQRTRDALRRLQRLSDTLDARPAPSRGP
ncbi:MAG: succinyldiaminopimelate transaminase [Pseudomonadota bacterium]